MGNVSICGRMGAEWSYMDQHNANVQEDARLALEVRSQQQSQHMQLRVRLHDEAEAKQVERDRTVMTNARKFHPRHRSINNANLATELFGIEGWNSACALCKKLGFDPKSIRCEVVENGK